VFLLGERPRGRWTVGEPGSGAHRLAGALFAVAKFRPPALPDTLVRRSVLLLRARRVVIQVHGVWLIAADQRVMT
jgi:hypothetical protein